MTLLDSVRQFIERVEHEHDTNAEYPSVPLGDIYDDEYPSEIAGHAEASAVFTDEPVNTTTGYDIGYDGDTQHLSHAVPAEAEGVGEEHVNESIESVTKSAHKAQDRRPISDVADDWRCDTITIKQTNRTQIINANPNRRSITITNQGTATVSVGRYDAITGVGAPGTVAIPVGAFRTFTHKERIYIIGAVGQTIDYVEEFDYR